jgi:hypothetical protein
MSLIHRKPIPLASLKHLRPPGDGKAGAGKRQKLFGPPKRLNTFFVVFLSLNQVENSAKRTAQ